MEKEIKKLTEESVKAKVEEIAKNECDNDVEVIAVSLPDDESTCMRVTIKGMVSIQTLAAIGEAYGDKRISIDGGYEKYQSDLYIIVNK